MVSPETHEENMEESIKQDIPQETPERKEEKTPSKPKDFSKEEYTEEDLKNRLKDIKDVEEFRKAMEEIIGNMEKKFLNINSKHFIDIKWYDWQANLEDDSSNYSIFEEKWIEILNRINEIMNEISVWNAELNLLAEFDKVAKELKTLQEQTNKNIKEDMDDWKLSHKEFIEASSFNEYYKNFWKALFDLHNISQKKFLETTKKMDLYDLIGGIFSIEDWAWAINDWFKEIKNRLKWRNLFKVIDELTQKENYNRKKDWTADTLDAIVINGLCGNWLINDLNNYLWTYEWADRIKQKIKRNLFLWWEIDLTWEGDLWKKFLDKFITNFEEIKKAPNLQDIAIKLETNKEIVRKLPNEKEKVRTEQPEIMRSKKANAVEIYDCDDLEWSWEGFFRDNINSYLSKGYKVITNESIKTEDIYTEVLENNNWDRITFALLKNKDEEFDTKDESYKRGLELLKDKWYNLIALRWHCYNTWWMVDVLAEQWVLKKWTILIDGWCWNAKNLSDYVSSWVESYVFSYRSTWKWDITEALFKQILKEKNTWWNLWTLLTSIDNLSKQYSHIKTMDKPDSYYNRYMFLKYWENDEIPDNEEYEAENNEPENIWDSDSSNDLASN